MNNNMVKIKWNCGYKTVLYKNDLMTGQFLQTFKKCVVIISIKI